MNSLVSFFCHCNPHMFFQSVVLRLYFTALEPWVARSVSFPIVPPGLSACKRGATHSASRHVTGSMSHCLASPCPPASALLQVLSAPAAISAPPPSLDGCLFFNSLVVKLPFSSISWHFLLLLFFNLLLSFFWLWEEAQCI